MGAFVIAGGDLMFRGSCFEYAGTYSGDYNLTIMYVENSYNKFDTGGSYKPITELYDLCVSEGYTWDWKRYIDIKNNYSMLLLRN